MKLQKIKNLGASQQAMNRKIIFSFDASRIRDGELNPLEGLNMLRFKSVASIKLYGGFML